MECTYVLTNDIACTRVCQLPSNKKDYTVWCANMLRQRSEERVWVCQSIVLQNLSCLTSDCSGLYWREATGYTPWQWSMVLFIEKRVSVCNESSKCCYSILRLINTTQLWSPRSQKLMILTTWNFWNSTFFSRPCRSACKNNDQPFPQVKMLLKNVQVIVHNCQLHDYAMIVPAHTHTIRRLGYTLTVNTIPS